MRWALLPALALGIALVAQAALEAQELSPLLIPTPEEPASHGLKLIGQSTTRFGGQVGSCSAEAVEPRGDLLTESMHA